jgi:glycosyltransferase involved in cell wall biosynthesis
MTVAAFPRVLQVVLSLHPGGTERLVLELVRRLGAEIPMAVCCLDAEGLWGNELQRTGVPVTTLSRQPGFHPGLSRGVTRAARAHKATLIHAHHYSPFVYSAIARLWGGPPVVFTEHGRLSDTGPSLKRRWANRALAMGARSVFTVSRELGDHLVAEGFPSSQVATIYNGIEIGSVPTTGERDQMRASLGIDGETFVVGTVARLDPVKDLRTLVSAVHALAQRRPAMLLIVGDGTERPALEAHAGAIDATASVRFLGHRDDARTILAACDAYANSSISEGISLTILEAMAAGLPIVATQVGGTPEIIDDAVGRLVPSRNSDVFAHALAALAQAPELRRALGDAGRARVVDRFTIERMVSDYARVYRRGGQKSAA